MLSWQGRMLGWYFRLQHRIHPPAAQFDYVITRGDLEKTARQFSVPKEVQVQAVQAGGVAAEWITLPGSDPDRVILYLHGGYYAAGSPRTHRGLVANLAAAARARALSVDYGLAPEHPFPRAVEDAVQAYLWLIKSEGLDPKNIAVAGDSAGGGLALAVMFRLRQLSQPLPAAAACFSPWTDLTSSGETLRTLAHVDYMLDPRHGPQAAALYLQGADPCNPLASPLFADLHGLPPLLIQVGAEEILLSDSTRLSENARSAGIQVELQVWPHMQHVWQFAGRLLPEAMQALTQAGEFLRRGWGEKPAVEPLASAIQ